ncbi:GNAT family N-acetyltransferase [Desertibaculum subflavum]|uniref:GNAT family N-acetyltransferase n=1 Tax=Desertibaculum subflavum TaxID=2268458 RepID=UPI000E66F832
MRPGDLSPRERAAWSRFQEAGPAAGIAFLSWQFVADVAAVNPHARVCVFGAADDPVAFFPFEWTPGWRGRIGIAGRVGGDISDYFGLVARSGFHITPAELLRAAGVPTLHFSHLDESQLAYGLTGEQPRIGLRIEFPDGGPAYLASLREKKKSLLRETERRFRKLEQNVGRVTFLADAADRPDLLELLVDAKIAQYDRTGAGVPPLATDFGRDLVRRLFRRRDPECTGVLSALLAGEDWVALHFGLRAAGTLHYWFPVYNPKHAALGPGRLLLHKTLETADLLGIHAIDRGEGDTPVKRDYATREHSFYMGTWRQPSMLGLIAKTALSLGWRIENRRRPAPEAESAKP